MIFQLVYTSTALEVPGGEADHQILTTSLFNNAERHITGFLLRQQDSYMQLLEGDELDVRALFRCIEKDQRHHRISLAGCCQRKQRCFPEWSMGFRHLDTSPKEAPLLLTRSPQQRCRLLAEFLFDIAWPGLTERARMAIPAGR